MQTIPTDEVAVFEQIHELLEQQRTGRRRNAPASILDGSPRFESRKANRRPYHCPQLLAPLKGRTPPAQADFALVQCRDISPNGFAYFTERQPTAKHVVVALGLAPFSFFVAEIVRVQPSATVDGPMLVGCRFLHRLEATTR